MLFQRGSGFNADGALFFGYDDSRELRIRDVASGETRAVLSHDSPLEFAVFSPADPKVLLTTTASRAVRIWDVSTQKERIVVQADERISRASFSADGKLLAIPNANEVLVVSLDGKVRQKIPGKWYETLFSADARMLMTQKLDSGLAVWDMATGTSLFQLPGGNPYVYAFSRDGSEFIYGPMYDSTLIVRNVRSGVERFATKMPGNVQNFSFSQDGRILVVGQPEGLMTFDYPAMTPRGALKGFYGFSIKMSEVDTLLCHREKNGRGHIMLVDIRKPVIIKEWDEPGRGFGLAISRDGRRGATLDGALTLWDTSSTRRSTFGGSNGTTNDMAWSPDGTMLATTTSYGLASTAPQIRLWDARSGQTRGVLSDDRDPDDGFIDVVWSPKGDRLSVSSRTDVTLWDPQERRRIVDLEDENDLYSDHPMTFSPDGSELATSGGNQGRIRIWRAVDGSLIRTIEGSGNSLHALSYSPDGKMLAAGIGRGVTLFGRTGETLGVVESTPPKTAMGIEWSSDSSTIVTHAGNDVVNAFDVKELKELWSIRLESTRRIRSIALGPGGVLAVGTDERRLELWDVTTRQQIRLVPGSQAAVTAVKFNPRAPILAAARGDVQFVRIQDESTLLLKQVGMGSRVSGVVYGDSGVYSGDEAAAGALRFRRGESLSSELLRDEDVRAELYHPILLSEFMAGCKIAR